MTVENTVMYTVLARDPMVVGKVFEQICLGFTAVATLAWLFSFWPMRRIPSYGHAKHLPSGQTS